MKFIGIMIYCEEEFSYKNQQSKKLDIIRRTAIQKRPYGRFFVEIRMGRRKVKKK